MAHIDNMIGSIQDEEKRQRVAALMRQPLAKAGYAWLPASEVSASYAVFKDTQQDHLLRVNGKQETYVPGDTPAKEDCIDTNYYEKQPHGRMTPVEMLCVNLNEVRGIHSDDFRTEKGELQESAYRDAIRPVSAERLQIYNDLIKLGCRVLEFDHNWPIPTGKVRSTQRKDGTTEWKAEQEWLKECCITLPRQYATHKHYESAWPQERTRIMEEDITGAGRMFAYMMAKDILSPQDIIKAYGKKWGEIYLKEACKPETAALLDEKLGLKAHAYPVLHSLFEEGQASPLGDKAGNLNKMGI